VVYKDGHWTDHATKEHLLFMADSIPTSRILNILTYCTGYIQPFGERIYHTRIALNALSTEYSVAMARRGPATERLPEEVNALIVSPVRSSIRSKPICRPPGCAPILNIPL
jgi:hypothetical protein